jgi:adenylate cyclase
MAYAFCHLLNHALGLVSVEAMMAAQSSIFAFWHGDVGTSLLLAALAVHVVLGVKVVATRLGRGMSGWQWLQLGLGVAIPLALAQHVAGTVLLPRQTDMEVGYRLVLLAVWPHEAVKYTLFILAVWLHGCLGLHFWWRLDPRYHRARIWLTGVAVAVPALAIGGFVAGGRDVANAARENYTTWAQAGNWPPLEEIEARVARDEAILLAVVFGMLTLAALWRLVQLWRMRRRRVTIRYASGRVTRGAKGQTLLEMSRAAGVPHAAVCGGRARCSTCRVRVTAGAETLAPPNAEEARLLERLGHPPQVRLACQIKPTSALAVVPLVAPPTALADAHSDADPSLGREREIAVLFADLRGFTALSERRLPYDVVYLLNQYFRAMGETIEAHGGHVDKFLGDGIMALFGLANEPDEAARAALAAAVAMSARLEELNAALVGELEQPLRMAVGVHLGPAIVGEMGHGPARQLTAIGDTVNVASRLEALAKSHDAELVASAETLARAGRRVLPSASVGVRGRSGELAVEVFARAADVEHERSEAPVAPAAC